MTKRGNISKQNGVWGIAPEFDWGLTEFTPIHPDYLPTILDGDNLKPEYQGEVEYEVEKKIKQRSRKGIMIQSYAIPKVSEYKGDVWEEARKECREHLKGKTFSDTADYYLEMLNYLEQHYTLTKI